MNRPSTSGCVRAVLAPHRHASTIYLGLLLLATRGLPAAARVMNDEPPSDDALHLEADDPVFDFGERFHGEVFEHVFRVTNKGKDPITLGEASTSCGCTFATGPSGKTFAPGESFEFTVRIESDKLPQAEVERGEQIRKAGEVVVNGKAVLRLWMQGFVREVLSFDPKAPRLEIIRDGPSPESARIKVKNDLGRDITLLGIEGDKKVVMSATSGLDASRRVAAGGSFEVELTPELREDVDVTGLVDRLAFRVRVGDSVTETAVPLPVSVRILDRIQVVPSRSFFFSKVATKKLAEGEVVAQKLTVKSIGRDAHRFRILGAASSEGAVKVTPREIDAGRTYELTIELLPPAEGTTRIKDKIIVETDDPLVPRIEIPGTGVF